MKLLDTETIDRLVEALRARGVRGADQLSPGLSDAELERQARHAEIALPQEAKVWWGYSEGAHGGEGALLGLGHEFAWVSLSWSVAYRDRILDNLRTIDEEDRLRRMEMLPFLGTDTIALDASLPDRAAIQTVSFGEAPEEQEEPISSLREFVEQLTLAFEVGAIAYDRSRGTFLVDFDVAEEHSIPSGVL